MNKPTSPTIIGIESSCDDTSAAVLKGNTILSNVVAGQQVHEKYGGVVPELASRAHQENIIPVVDQALKEANITANELDAIAFTKGPGLLGSLLVGTSFAKSLAMSLDKPLIEVNHMEAHLLAHFIDDCPDGPPTFPFLCLTVSGGHTQLVLVKSYFEMEVIGETIDDAAGEAFDKAAKLLQLPYPGGPVVDKLAREGNAQKFEFPIPRIEGLNYSFSGLKTSLLYFLQQNLDKDPKFIEKNTKDICASYQEAITTFLVQKLKRAADEYDIKTIVLAGGVSANSGLREKITQVAQKKQWETHFPPLKYCTDNGAMIAIAGKFKFEKGLFSSLDTLPTARWKPGSAQ